MKAIHLANAKKRDAQIAIDVQVHQKTIRFVLDDGSDKINVKLVKSTGRYDEQSLSAIYGDIDSVARAIVESDPETDMETVGRLLHHTHKLYLDGDGNIAYRINLFQVVRNPDGSEKERRDLNRVPANANSEIPLQWTGRMFPRDEAIRRFVFSRKYQLKHVNGVTFDFLYNMAKDLWESDSLVLIGSGPRGNGPILLSRGGSPYRGFLEGRIDGDTYCLILHLTSIELKGLEYEDL